MKSRIRNNGWVNLQALRHVSNVAFVKDFSQLILVNCRGSMRFRPSRRRGPSDTTIAWTCWRSCVRLAVWSDEVSPTQSWTRRRTNDRFTDGRLAKPRTVRRTTRRTVPSCKHRLSVPRNWPTLQTMPDSSRPVIWRPMEFTASAVDCPGQRWRTHIIHPGVNRLMVLPSQSSAFDARWRHG